MGTERRGATGQRWREKRKADEIVGGVGGGLKSGELASECRPGPMTGPSCASSSKFKPKRGPQRVQSRLPAAWKRSQIDVSTPIRPRCFQLDLGLDCEPMNFKYEGTMNLSRRNGNGFSARISGRGKEGGVWLRSVWDARSDWSLDLQIGLDGSEVRVVLVLGLPDWS